MAAHKDHEDEMKAAAPVSSMRDDSRTNIAAQRDHEDLT